MPNSFSIRDDISKKIEELIFVSYDSYPISYSKKVFSPNDLLECSRKIIYNTRNKNFKLSQKLKNINSEKFIKTKWIQYLKQCSGLNITGENIRAGDCNFNIETIIDGVIEIKDFDNLQAVISIKSLSEEEFNKIIDKPSRKDIICCIIDMWLIEIPYGFLFYENRNNMNYIIHRVMPCNAIINSVKSKSKNLLDCMIKEILPDRPYKSASSEECKNCEFLRICWG